MFLALPHPTVHTGLCSSLWEQCDAEPDTTARRVRLPSDSSLASAQRLLHETRCMVQAGSGVAHGRRDHDILHGQVQGVGLTMSCKPMRKKGRTGMTTSGNLQKWTFCTLSACSEKQGEFPTDRMPSFQVFLFRA